MASNMQAEAPTFYSLNKAQRRALMLREGLRWTDSHHLDSFMVGLSEPEPPVYKRSNGNVVPSLAMVTVSAAATRFDLGNVKFDPASDAGPAGIHRAYLTVEDGSFELRTEEALVLDQGHLEAVPIHSFIAKTMVGLFEAKFKAIWARKNQINEIRRAAFEMASKARDGTEFSKGMTLLRLEPGRGSQGRSSSQDNKIKKLRPGESLPKHPSNKRKAIGLDTIPQYAKTATFNAIPNNIKVDLFNNVIKTAFPNFDNLMMASWNVVSVYSNVGTDFPELHKSIVELKNVLQDFEESFTPKVDRAELQYRHDFAPPTQERSEDDGNQEHGAPNQPTHDAAQRNGNNGNAPAAPLYDTDMVDEQQDKDVVEQKASLDALLEDSSPKPSPKPKPKPESKHTMPPPRMPTHGHQPFRTSSPHRSPTPRFTSGPTTPRPSPPHPKRKRSPSTESTELQRRRSEYRASLAAQHRQLQPADPTTTDNMVLHSSADDDDDDDDDDKDKDEDDNDNDPIPATAPPAGPKKTPRNKSSDGDAMSVAALRERYNERKKQLLDTWGGNANVPNQYRAHMFTLREEIKRREAEEAMGDQGGSGGGRQATSTIASASASAGTAGIVGTTKGVGLPDFLGNSILGGKKKKKKEEDDNDLDNEDRGGLGMAPVAPMVHTARKDGVGGGVGKKRS
ncbi:hypothetical protein ACEQ8H_000347 [Pleosporales sp. CAS-2024a]